MKPAPGTLVTRNVKLVRPLGKGGMGSVWVGEHTTLETEVAVKFISPEHAEKKRFVARFRREASSAAKIKSPHVVQVFDHGVTDAGVPYIVMELLQGEPLSKRLRRGPLSPREASMLVSQVGKVLTTAHDLGIVHRDLKPDNLYLLESGYELFVKVLDFGIAKQLVGEISDITDTGAMVGTPYYMSPEMLLSPKDADHRADLWALAVVAYHTLTGELPFRGETLGALSVAINDGEFKPPSAIVGTLGSEVDVWFKLALCRNVDARFSSANDLVQGFRQALLLDSNDQSGDRTSHPLDSDSLPETARPPSADPEVPTGDTDADVRQDTAGPTVTSEQLAKIRSGEEVSGDAQTLPAADTAVTAGAMSTLEGTASAGDTPRAGWGRRLAMLVAALLAVAVVVFMLPGRREPAVGGAGSADAAPTTPSASAVPAASPVASPSPALPPSADDPPPPSPPAPASVAAPDPEPRPHPRLPPLQPPSEPTASPRVKCANPFVVDANGDLQPRPGCF